MMNIALIIAIVLVLALTIAMFVFYNQNKLTQSKFKSILKDKANYESIIEQANDAVFVIDIVDGRIHQTNPSAAQLLGYSPLELVQLSLFEIHPKDMLERSSSVVADVWEKGGLIYKDLPFVTKSGELLPVECSAKVAPFAGRPAIVIYARDIRERLRLENEVREQKEIIEQKNKDITDSIEYAKNIQEAILPSRELFNEIVNDSFILFLPKDIVSGDFYWFVKREHNLLFAAADCTGHGVPGALMSIVGNSGLNDVVNLHNITKPSDVLNGLREAVIGTLKQADVKNDRKDGMDIALCNLDLKTNIIQFAGAFNSLWVVRNGIAQSELISLPGTGAYTDNLLEVKANKFPVGNYVGASDDSKFTNHEFQLQKGDCVYVFTDGYADQFGGPKGKKFKYKQLMDLIISLNDRSMKEQHQILLDTITKWRGNLEQVDDILIMGVRV